MAAPNRCGNTLTLLIASLILLTACSGRAGKFAAKPVGDTVAITSELMKKHKDEIRKLNIVPKPVRAEVKSGSFTINAETKIALNPDNAINRRIAVLLADRITTASGMELAIVPATEAAENAIILEAALGLAQHEAYTLHADSGQVVIRGAYAGLFYGMQTLLQMLPPKIFAHEKAAGIAWTIPVVEIADEPRFKWRGMHLDVSRHFFGIDFVKEYIDLLAMHKLNVFHWHLVDDQGWRIEIRKYPLLTEKAAWREGTGTEPWDYFVGPAIEDKPKYGGFYTQEEIRDIVQYAKDRFITVVPEIEMPGHSRAALDAYPEMYCTGKPYERQPGSEHFFDPFCAGNEKSFQFLENVLEEVLELFPSEYIHIGGDEAPKHQWEACPKCNQRMQDEGMTDTDELQSYFITRMEKFLNSKGRKIIGWDEILEGGLAPNAAVMSWRGNEGGITAAQANHAVVMSPTTHCYFNNPHEALTLDKIYSYEPIPSELNTDQAKYVMGAQGNVWTEGMITPTDVEHMALPRMSAMSEVVWSQKEHRDFAGFTKRMDKQYERFDAMGMNYFGSEAK